MNDKRKIRYRTSVSVIPNCVIVDKSTGEELEAKPVVKKRVGFDASEFVKVYDLWRLSLLSSSELKVFCYLLNGMSLNSRLVHLLMSECIEFTGLCESTIRGCIKRLVDKGFIVKETNDLFTINSDIACKGRRDNN